MLAEALGTAVAVGKVRGGKLQNLSAISIRHWELLVVSGLVEAAGAYIRRIELEPVWRLIDSHVLWIQLLTYSLLAYVLLVNRKEKGFLLILLGVLLNFAVIMANGGRMPVDAGWIDKDLYPVTMAVLESGKDLTHSMMDDHTRMRFLGDIIHLKKPYPLPKSLSIGDLWMMLGIFIFIQEKMIVNSGKIRRKTG
ncbi:DUF5317 domain-containing protein [Geosporobacter ferrireducens]|uniref:DUF5317 domain-containing protein n=1 Tax=Geosporobacter ferrireducens TaxID=1424294 RepID=A0A1D8GGG9_9FIRM|nr:DUF5317 domain-containing protein [Geosporobacter ferrireducens]AOT70011.1 hypothetical protein Gferi_10680 [Geosporobacter ferrireducens]